MGRGSYWSGASWRGISFSAPARALVQDRSTDDYQPQFDGLRALAVLTVMVDHFSADVPNFPLPDWIHLGATGVRLFLVLSGYFITSSLRRARDRMDAGALSATLNSAPPLTLPRLSTGAGHLLNVGKIWRSHLAKTFCSFYWRRLLRIGPAYLVFVAIALLLGLGEVRHNWAWVFTGTVNWLIASTNEWPVAISHLWSICVQEQFYLVWPLLILLLPRRWMLSAIVTVALAGIAFRIGCVFLSVPIIDRWVLPFGSLDSLAGGAALGWCGGRLKASRGGWLLGLVCMLMLIVAAFLRNSDPTQLKSVLVEPLEAGAFIILIARTATGFDGFIGRLLSNTGLVFAGRISYGLYIYHILVAMVFTRWLPPELRFIIAIPALRLVVFGIVTLFTAALSWRLLEQPINRLRGETPRNVPPPRRGWEPESARAEPLAVIG